MTTVNRTVRAHLRQVIDEERSRTARVLTRLRLGGALGYLALSAWFGFGQGLADWRETVPVLAGYAVLGAALIVLVDRSTFIRRHAGLSVALLDMPALLLASWIAIPHMQQPLYLLGAVPTALACFVILTGLALDTVAIGVATGAACLSALVLVVRLGAPMSEVTPPLFGLLASGVVTAFLVSRVQRLVEESRRRDFGGKYVLGERIGTGGMAEVFTATYSPDGGFERRVAVKRILPAYASDEQFLALFRREAELGAQLAHPNVVQVLDFGRHGDAWFLAMEYVDGVPASVLFHEFGLRGAFVPLSACLYILAEVAEGLAYIHEKRAVDGGLGLVHRDLNPPNVLLSRSGEVKISDFGVARWLGVSTLTQAGTVRGKLAYMAPEQVRGDEPAAGWDLFALGITAHELICGRPLFRGRTETETLRVLLEGDIPAPSTLRPEVPREVDAIVLGLLERDPRQRTASAREVSQRLRPLQGPSAPYPTGRDALLASIALLAEVSRAQDAPTERRVAPPAAETETLTARK